MEPFRTRSGSLEEDIEYNELSEEDMGNLSDEKILDIFSKLSVQKLLEYETCSNTKISDKAKQTLSDNLVANMQNTKIDSNTKANLLVRYHERAGYNFTSDNHRGFLLLVENGQADLLSRLLKDDKIDPSVNNNEAIRLACTRGNTEIIKLLLAHQKVDPSANDNEAIRYASEVGLPEVVKLLLAHAKVDPSEKDNEAIRYASANGCKEVVELLLALRKVDPSANYNQAIRLACARGHTEVVRLLLNHYKVDPSANNNRAIKHASEGGFLDIVKLLLEHEKVDPSANANEALIMASTNGHLEIVNLLMSHENVDPSSKNNDAIRQACMHGHTEIVRVLLAHDKVDPSARDHEALFNAIHYGYTEVVKLLLAHRNIDPSTNNNEAIRMASENNQPDIVRLLLVQEKVDPSALQNEAIVEACKFGYVEVVNILLADKRVDPSVYNNQALRNATSSKWASPEIVSLLLAHEKVDPSAINNDAIVSASENGYLQIMSLLLAHPKVDPSAKNNKAIKLASANGRTGAVKLLLAHEKVDPSVNNNEALRMAMENEHKDVVKLLLSHKKIVSNSRIIIENLRTILEVYQDKAQPILTKAAKDLPELYSQEVYKNPGLLKYIKEKYPMNSVNSVLYPVIINTSSPEELSISTVGVKSLFNANQVLRTIANCQDFKKLDIRYIDNFDKDSTGISKQFITQLFSGLMSQNIGSLKFISQKDGGYLPEVNPATQGDEMKCLEKIGNFLALSLNSKGKFPIGQEFSNGFFEHLLLLDTLEVQLPTEEYIQNLTEERLLNLYRPLVDEKERKSISKLHHLLQVKNAKEAKCAINYFISIGVLEETLRKNLEQCKRDTFKKLKERFLSKLAASHAIARGLSNSFPLSVIVDENIYMVSEWNDLKIMPPPVMNALIQGHIDKDTIKSFIEVSFNEEAKMDNRIKNRLKDWVNEWIDKQPEDMSTLKKYLTKITGAPVVSSKILFKISTAPVLHNLHPHTGLNEVDIPLDILSGVDKSWNLESKKQTIFAQFDSWVRGEQLSEVA